MGKSSLKIASFKLAISLFVVGLSQPLLWAEEDSATQALQQTRERILEQDRHQRELLAQLHQLQGQIREISRRRGQLNQEMLAAQTDARQVAQNIAELEDSLAEQRSVIRQRLRAMYMLGARGGLALLFSATNSHDLDRNLKFLKLITERDHQLMRHHQMDLARLKRQHEAMARRVRHLTGLQNLVQNQEDLLDSEQKNKIKVLNQVRRSTQEQIRRAQGLRARAELESLLQPTFFEKRGQLKPPVQGDLGRNYGLFTDPEYRFRLLHKGQLYYAPLKSEVKSVFPGRVAFAGPLEGYGQAVILDHGNSYYTVYAYLSELLVSQDQAVDEGQVISRVGQGLLEARPGVYFEIRHFSDAIDPQPWLTAGRTTP